MKRQFLLTVLAAFAVVGTALAAARATMTARILGQSTQIGVVWETDEFSAEDGFRTIDGVSETPRGSIWVSDMRGRVVWELSADGTGLRSVAGTGEGPGEVLYPGMIARDDADSMYIFDLARSSLEIFDADGQFKRRLLLDRRLIAPKGMTISSATGAAVISGASAASSYSIFWFSLATGRAEATAHRIPVAERPESDAAEDARYVAGGPVFYGHDGVLFFSQSAPHEILMFPSPQSEPRVVAEDPELLESVVDTFRFETVEDGVRRINFRWFYPQTRGVFELPSGVLLNIVTFQEEGRSLWEFYSPSGELLERVNVPRPYWPWSLTSDGDVLASDPDFETGRQAVVRLSVDGRWVHGRELP